MENYKPFYIVAIIIIIILILSIFTYCFAYLDKDLVFSGKIERVEFTEYRGFTTLIFVEGRIRGYYVPGLYNFKIGSIIEIYESFLEGRTILIDKTKFNEY